MEIPRRIRIIVSPDWLDATRLTVWCDQSLPEEFDGSVHDELPPLTRAFIMDMNHIDKYVRGLETKNVVVNDVPISVVRLHLNGGAELREVVHQLRYYLPVLYGAEADPDTVAIMHGHLLDYDLPENRSLAVGWTNWLMRTSTREMADAAAD